MGLSQFPWLCHFAGIGAKNRLLGEPLDGAGNLISGSVGDLRQLRELPRISALRFGFPTHA
jgi:hypothetical protein